MSDLLLVTGATGKVGRATIARLRADPARASFKVRALCHSRSLERLAHDLPALIDAGFDYRRAADDPRIVWYPG